MLLPPADLASSSSALRVRFNSDAVTQGNGFLALLDSAPGGLYSSRSFDCAHSPSATITQTSGVVTDGEPPMLSRRWHHHQVVRRTSS
eukprot:1608428-Rhodomonas_salina.1